MDKLVHRLKPLPAVFVLLLCHSGPVAADKLRVAVASNFTGAMSTIVSRFEAETGHEVSLSAGSTGKHYAQIVNGAPFDLFFAADTRRPQLLEQEGRAVDGSRFTYAIGKLVLWSPRTGFVDRTGDVLRSGEFRFLSIANPDLAPYGKAAREALSALGLLDLLEEKLVRGENIGQAYQFVHSGNAELGFVAQSQLQRSGSGIPGSYWAVPGALHSPIEQQAVLLKDTDAARDLMDFMRSDSILQLIGQHGYLTP